jgi:hypothetical protein
LPRTFVINEPTVVHDTIDGEVLIIRNDTGVYYSLDGPGASIWQAIAAGKDEAEIAATVGADVASFLDQLVTEQLVLADGDDEAAALPAAATTSDTLVAPELHRYTDMQDLLLFDPIHEVSPDGWPNVVAKDGQAST